MESDAGGFQAIGGRAIWELQPERVSRRGPLYLPNRLTMLGAILVILPLISKPCYPCHFMVERCIQTIADSSFLFFFLQEHSRVIALRSQTFFLQLLLSCYDIFHLVL